MNRYFAYCRKSTEEDDRQILSIESQQKELKRHAEKEKLHVVATVEESRSAKTTGRPVFNELLQRIARGEANGILAWHPDRLARNALDGGQIIQLLDTGKLADLRFPTYTFENTSQGKFMLAIMFGQSKYMVDSLIENVRRGNRTKREKGWFPGYAPVGYLNAKNEMGDKIIVPDPERFILIKKIWQLFLTGAYSVPQLTRIANMDLNLRSRRHKKSGGRPFGKTGIYQILTRPFYTGHIVYKGKWYPAKHEPMITLSQFERARSLLRRGTRSHPKRQHFAYAGMLRCGNCNGGVTAEEHYNRHGYHYVYYHCTHKPNVWCKERSIEEEELQRQILAFIERISLDKEQTDEALAIVNKQKAEETGNAAMKQSLEKALGMCSKSLDNLTQLRCRELITDEEFVRQRAELAKEQETFKERLRHLETSDWFEPSQDLFLFSNRAKFWLLHGTIEEKRIILSTISSNLLLKDKKLIIDAKKPFSILAERTQSSLLCTEVNGVRTFFQSEPGFYIPELRSPEELAA